MSLIKTEELPIIEKQKTHEIIKTEEITIHKETKHINPAEPDIHKDVKLELPPAKRMEKAMAWAEKPSMPAPAKPIGTPMENGKTPIIREEPAAKRVEKVLAWFEKVGVPEPEQPKIDRQPEDIPMHSGRALIKPRTDIATHYPKTAPKTETAPQQAKIESHHTLHNIKPQAIPENKQEETKAEKPIPSKMEMATHNQKTAHKTETAPQQAKIESHHTLHNIKPQAIPENKQEETKAEKPIPPKMERKIESSVLPPRSAVSKHETAWSSDPITPPVARKIGLSKIGMTEKPLEGKDEGKKEAVVPGSSISGFGPNKRIYQCPKCGGRTLVEGELCKICKMTLEHPQEMVQCERCGLTNNRNIKFCRKCGTKLDKDKT